MADDKIKPGEVVKLKSGSDQMTVLELRNEEIVTVGWYVEGQRRRETLQSTALRKLPNRT